MKEDIHRKRTMGPQKADKAANDDPIDEPVTDAVDLNWPLVAENVTTLLDMTRRGDREVAVASLAFTYKTYPSRLRQAVSSRRFVAKVAKDTENVALAEALVRERLSLVDIVSRWAAHDMKGALVAARDLVAGQHTYRSLVAAERVARASATRTPKAKAAVWLARVERALFDGPAEDMLRVAAPAHLTESPFAIWLKKDDSHVAVQVMGPFPTAIDYNRNILSNVYRSLGACHLGFEAWIALPVGTAGDRYRAAIGQICPGGIEIVELDLPV